MLAECVNVKVRQFVKNLNSYHLRMTYDNFADALTSYQQANLSKCPTILCLTNTCKTINIEETTHIQTKEGKCLAEMLTGDNKYRFLKSEC